MRVIAEMPYPNFKLTIFSMNRKFILKMEQGHLEQTYKIAEVEIIGGVDDLFKLLDEEMIAKIESTFIQMRSDFNEAYRKYEVS